jgi:Flp pilus assembly protein TadG
MALLGVSRFRSDEGGAAVAELAVVLPVLLLLTFGLIEVGRALWTATTLTRATYAAARCGAMNQALCDYTTPTTIQSYAVSQAWGLGLTNAAFTVTTPSDCGGQTQASVKVVASYSVPIVIPFGPVNWPLSASACYAKQY